jgi:hypothetical protein
VKLVVEHFGKRPYGWWDWATVCAIAMMHARGKIEVRRDVELLEGDSLANALRNTHQHAQLVLEPQVEFTPSQLRNLKKFASDFFNKPFDATEARALGNEIADEMKVLAADLEAQVKLAATYPFMRQLEEPLAKIKGHAGKSYSHYFKKLKELEDELQDAKESVVDPILSFINGGRKDIYDKCRKLLLEQKDNFGYLEEDTSAELQELVDSVDCYRGTAMRDAKTLLDSLEQAIEQHLATEKAAATHALDAMRDKLDAQSKNIDLTEEQSNALSRPFDDAGSRIAETRHIAVVREAVHTFQDETYEQLVTKLAGWARTSPGDDTPQLVESVRISQLGVDFAEAWLQDEAAVERYLERLKDAMLREIRAGKRLIV